MSDAPDPRPARSLPVKVGLTALCVAMVASAFAGTFAAFSSTTSAPNNTFTTGTVALSDNDSGSAILALPAAAKPGDTDTSCIRVSYSGTLASTVRLYGTTTGTGLDAYLTLTVTRGTLTTAFPDCTGFTADTTNYLTLGNGVIYNGTVQGFADDYAGGIVDPKVATPESWTTGETHDYRFTVTVADSDAAQGKTATQAFTWEARNS
jgi:predicted ribosomally synthesized peptide with SipW-like signal peptide